VRLPERPAGRTASKTANALGDAVQSFLRSRGLDILIKYPDVVSAWERVVGPDLAEHTRVVGFKRGVLEVSVDSSALMNEIGFSRATLLRALQGEIRKPFVSGIAFVLKTAREENDDDGTE